MSSMTTTTTTPVSDPALSILHRALLGDAGALSFVDRTLSIYVLDASTCEQPKTYGSWNFIHEAMNEIERQRHDDTLEAETQLLANICHRVARKSPAADRALVETCIANAPFSLKLDSAKLVERNEQLREIVMGRIAAVVFDVTSNTFRSCLEEWCASLAANAISTGPHATNHLLLEWIVPSRTTLPPLAVASVVLGVASEATRRTAPSKTQDQLQQLSQNVMGLLLVPLLHYCTTTANTNDDNNNNTMIATCIRAMTKWFIATDLSLPQLKHVCQKVGIDIIPLILDCMYSDSPIVVSSMAEWMEVALQTTKMSTARMAQARWLMQVENEAFFQQAISKQELERIEEKEMVVIVKECMEAIGLQRFRFVERQAKLDHQVCLNLIRIAAAVCHASHEDIQEGMVDLLLKAAAHPMVSVCSIALEVLLLKVLQDNDSSTGATFTFRLLPVLQHRAIVPNVPNLVNACGVDLIEFENFRECVLQDALVACFQQNPIYYMDSCTSAIEEFCNIHAQQHVGFQLEAALFCFVAVATEALEQHDNTQDANKANSNNHDAQLGRCIVALTTAATTTTANPLTLGQMCRFLGSYASWFAKSESLDSAAELALNTFKMASSSLSFGNGLLGNMPVSPFSRAAKALENILTQAPRHFTTIPGISALGNAWEVSYIAAGTQGNAVTLEDRKALCRGICCVLASLPKDQRSKSFVALSLPTMDCLLKMTKFANDTRAAQQPQLPHHLDAVLVRIAHEIEVLSTMTNSLDHFVSDSSQQSMESGSAMDETNGSTNNPSLDALQRAWPCLTHVSRTYYSHERVATALGVFLAESVPKDVKSAENFTLLKDLHEMACSILKSAPVENVSPRPVFGFVEEVIRVYGNAVERSAANQHSADSSQDSVQEIGRLVKVLLLTSVDAAKATLWTTQSNLEQGQGQQPFECKTEPRPVTQEREKSTDALSGLFSILTLCTQKCPVFLVHLPATSDADRDDDVLLIRAVEAAVAALVEAHDEVCISAMVFLKAAVELYESSTLDGGQNGIQTVRQVMEGVLTRTRQSIIMMLVAGVCGTFCHVALEPASILFYAVLKTLSTEECESYLVAALRQDHFLLGDDARNATLAVLMRCASGDALQSLTAQVFAEVWSLHQTDDAGAVAGGDVVMKFVQTYAG